MFICEEEGTMWRKNTAWLLILPLASLLLSPGCATLTRRSTQRIPVTSVPLGAAVIVNGVEQGVTPLEIRLPRKRKAQVIRIESSGYNPFEIQMKRKISAAMLLGDYVLGAGLGYVAAIVAAGEGDPLDPVSWFDWMKPLMYGSLAGILAFSLVDLASGKVYMMKPKELSISLSKADGTPRVDTMLIDAEEFQNIKWIRVHRD